MTMHHGFDIRAMLHDRQVQQNFAGPLLFAGDLIAVQIHRTNVIRRHEPFTDHRRGTEDFVFTDAD